MESRKTVPLSLFAGQQQRCRRGEWTCGHRVGGEDGTNWEARGHVYTAMCAVA